MELYEQLARFTDRLNELITKPTDSTQSAALLVEENQRLAEENALLKDEAAKLKEELNGAESRAVQSLIEKDSIKDRVERLIRLFD